MLEIEVKKPLFHAGFEAFIFLSVILKADGTGPMSQILIFY